MNKQNILNKIEKRLVSHKYTQVIFFTDDWNRKLSDKKNLFIKKNGKWENLDKKVRGSIYLPLTDSELFEIKKDRLI